VVFPIISACFCDSYVFCSWRFLSSFWRFSWFVTMNSPRHLSCSFILFYSAATCNRCADAVYLSLIISALFSEMPLCISEHIRPYCWIVKVFLSIPLDSIIYWLCSSVLLSTTFLSKLFMVLLASISYYLIKAVSSAYYLSWFPTYLCRCANSASTFTLF
jgi:hypothetical protein